MFSILLYVVSLYRRLVRRKVSSEPHVLAVQLTAPTLSEPQVIVAMAEGAQQAHEANVAIDVLITATGDSHIAEIVEAVEPHAREAESVDLTGASAGGKNGEVYLHFAPSDEK